MNWTRHFFPERLLLLALSLCLCAVAVRAALPFAEEYARGVELLLEGDAAQSAMVLQRVVDTHGDNAETIHGPLFGNVLYNLGAAYQQLGQHELAARAFERCYRYFPNEADNPETNAYHALSLGAWAATEQARRRYPEAARLYARAIRLEDPALNRNELMLNLAICLAQANEPEAALRIFRRLLNSQAAASLRLQAFLQLARHHIEGGELSAAQQLLDHHEALKEVMREKGVRLNPTILYLAARCTYQQAARQALHWYDWLAPDPSANDPVTSPELHAAMLGKAHARFQLGEYEHAHSIYAELATFPGIPKHDEILLAASFSASYLDRFEEAAEDANTLVVQYPHFTRWPDAYVLLTDRLLRAERAEEALTVAEFARASMPATHPAREPIDFAVASALYRLEAYPDAQSEFARYLESFPEAERAAVAHYTMALCLFQAAQWQETIARLDEVEERYPETTLADGLLYHRAAAAAQLARYDDALSDLNALWTRYPDSLHLPLALNLLGDLHWTRQDGNADADAALAAFKAVPEAAAEPAAYSLRRRIEIHIAQASWQTALDLLAHFDARHPHSPELVTAAAAASIAYRQAQQVDDGLAYLEVMLIRHAGDVEGHTLQTLLHAYETLCKEEYGYTAFMERLVAFPHPERPSPRLQALLLMARIEALESLGAAEQEAETLHTLHARLLREIPTAALPDAALLKLARWLRTREAFERAAHYYALLEARPEGAIETTFARIEHATLLAEQGNIETAIERLTAVRSDAPSTRVRESATLEEARILFRARDWERAAALWQDYLDQPDWLQARAEATYRLGASLDRLGRTDEALAMYVTSYVTYEGQINWASPAFLRSALIERERGDETRALAILDDMMDRMGHLSHPIVDRARTLHRRWHEDPDGDQT